MQVATSVQGWICTAVQVVAVQLFPDVADDTLQLATAVGPVVTGVHVTPT